MARWREVRGIAQRLRADRDLTSPVVPAVIAGVLALVIGVAATVLHLLNVPAGLGGLILSGLATLTLLISYLIVPKPALILFALFVLFRNTIDRWAGYTITFADDFLVPLLFLLAVWQFRPWRTGRLVPLREAAVVAVVGLAIISSLVNGVPLFVWASGLLLMAKVFAFLYIATWHDYTAADLRQMCIFVGAVAFVVIALGYVETAVPQAFADFMGRDRPPVARGELPSARSLFYHPVLYGWFSAFAALFLFAGWVVYRRWWMLVGGLIASVAVALSARRRAMLALLAGFFGGAAASELGRPMRWTRAARRWMPLGVALLIITAVAWSLGDLVRLTEEGYLPNPVTEPAQPGEPVDPGTSAEATDQARILLYRGSVTVALDHFPLGAGLGRYGSWMSIVEYSPLYYDLGFDRVYGLSPRYRAYITDTFWPQILGETGVFGLLAYLAFTAALAWQVWHASRQFLDNPLLRFFTLAVLMVFANALVETLASSMFHSPPRIYLLFGAVGVSLALVRMRRDVLPSTAKLPPSGTESPRATGHLSR